MYKFIIRKNWIHLLFVSFVTYKTGEKCSKPNISIKNKIESAT